MLKKMIFVALLLSLMRPQTAGVRQTASSFLDLSDELICLAANPAPLSLASLAPVARWDTERLLAASDIHGPALPVSWPEQTMPWMDDRQAVPPRVDVTPRVHQRVVRRPWPKRWTVPGVRQDGSAGWPMIGT